MSKRRPGLEPRDRDDWPTPWLAVAPLLKVLEPRTKFVEPCCGAGELIGHLENAGHRCAASYDLPVDARTASYPIGSDELFITNLPFRRRFEPNRIIANLSEQRPLWALMYSDWLFTSQATPHLSRLRAIVVIGRVQWIPGSPYSGGMENSCWLLFDKPRPDEHAAVRLIGRVARARANPDNSPSAEQRSSQ
jgi:hypothetical protein